VDRWLLAVERPQHVAELAMAPSLTPSGAVAAGAAHVRAHPAHLLLGHLDRIEGLPCDPLRRTAELTERVLRPADASGCSSARKRAPTSPPFLLVAQEDELNGVGDPDSCAATNAAMHMGRPLFHVERTRPRRSHPRSLHRREASSLLAGGGYDVTCP